MLKEEKRMDSPWTAQPNLTQLNLTQPNLTELNQSIYQEKNKEIDGVIDIENYKRIIAENIELEILYDIAKRKGADEVAMVTEIYETICDMVTIPRDKIIIKQTEYPWNIVKSQFLKLKRVHIANILNRIVDADLGIKNMASYLISTIYTESMSGTIGEQAELHDEYLKHLRGNPYSV